MAQIKRKVSGIALAATVATLISVHVYAMDIPVAQSESTVEGHQVLTQIYEIPSDADPATLIQEQLEKGGYVYELDSIVKEPQETYTERDFSQVVELTLSAKTESAAREEAIKYMKPSILFDDGVDSGELYVIPGSLSLSPVNERTVYGSKSVTKQYTNEYNDDTVVPDSVSEGGYTYKLADISWAEGAMGEDGLVPENYVATATYRRSTSSVVNDGFAATIEYAGTIGHTEGDVTRYTITYFGYPVIVEEPSLLDRVLGNDEPIITVSRPGTTTASQQQNGQERHAALVKLLRYALFAAGALLTLGIIYVVSRKLLTATVTIYARDEHSGEDRKIQRMLISKRKPKVVIKELRAPSSKHFLVSVRRRMAGDLLGKNMSIQVGKRAFSHTVGPCYGDTYQIPVDIS